MTKRTVRKVKPEVVAELRELAARKGTLKELLLDMPSVGTDADFRRTRRSLAAPRVINR